MVTAGSIPANRPDSSSFCFALFFNKETNMVTCHGCKFEIAKDQKYTNFYTWAFHLFCWSEYVRTHLKKETRWEPARPASTTSTRRTPTASRAFGTVLKIMWRKSSSTASWSCPSPYRGNHESHRLPDQVQVWRGCGPVAGRWRLVHPDRRLPHYL